MYDTVTGEVWECKRFNGGITCSKSAALTQLSNYVNNGILKADPDLKLCYGGTYTTIEPDVFEIWDNDGEGVYVVSYWEGGDGVIFYDYYYQPSAAEIVGNVAGVALGAALIFGLAWCTGGASLGALAFL